MTAAVLARPANPEGRRGAGQPKARGPVAPPRRAPGYRDIWLGQRASVQFAAPVRFRVVSVEPATTCDGWVWVRGYQLGDDGLAAAQRTVFIRESALPDSIRAAA